MLAGVFLSLVDFACSNYNGANSKAELVVACFISVSNPFKFRFSATMHGVVLSTAMGWYVMIGQIFSTSCASLANFVRLTAD